MLSKKKRGSIGGRSQKFYCVMAEQDNLGTISQQLLWLYKRWGMSCTLAYIMSWYQKSMWKILVTMATMW